LSRVLIEREVKLVVEVVSATSRWWRFKGRNKTLSFAKPTSDPAKVLASVSRQFGVQALKLLLLQLRSSPGLGQRALGLVANELGPINANNFRR